jgi:uncharacterized membrane protein
MARLACWLVVAVVLGGAVLVAATFGALPAKVATHFGRGGIPNGWMTREGYTWFALAFTSLLPLVVLGAIGWLPQRFPRLANLPNREYWLAAPRLAGTLAWMRGFGAATAFATALFAIGTHALILDANARAPAHLDEPLLFALLAAFVVAIVAGVIAMAVKFRRAS